VRQKNLTACAGWGTEATFVLLWRRLPKLEYRSEEKKMTTFFLGREPQYLLSLLPVLQKDVMAYSWLKTV